MVQKVAQKLRGVETMIKYGYARVSTEDQSFGMQLDYFTRQGITSDHIYSEKRSGADADRPALLAVLKILQAGDELHIYSLSRLGRTSLGLHEIFADLKKRGVRVISSLEYLDTSTPIGGMMLAVLAGSAQFERELIVERVNAGIKAAKQNGVKFGRPKVNPAKLEAAESLLNVGTPFSKVAAITGVSKRSLHYYFKQAK